MGPGTSDPRWGDAKSRVGLPCLTCKGKKRTLCVRSNRKAGWTPQHWGHADLALIESNANGGQPSNFTGDFSYSDPA